MTTLDRLWYLADEAEQAAEQAYHRAIDRYGDGGFLERTHRKHVSRDRFRTLVERIRASGAPYGAHSLVYRADGAVLLARHQGVDLWVLPGGGVSPEESFREAARRELAEEAGIEARYEGLALLCRIEIRCADYDSWGVMPVFAARAETTTPTVSDPDGEISDAKWFQPAELPADTRDRQDIIEAARTVI